jgi:menaquinone reductase, multiheme cytochrome c subunit
VKQKSLIMVLAGFGLGLLGGWVAFPFALYRTESQPIQFSHKVHTGEQGGMSCDNCHEFTPDGRFVGVPALDKCAECHSSTLGTSPNEKRFVEEFVTPRRPVPWLVYSRQPDNAFFPHATHVKLAGMACEECHGPQGTGDSLKDYQENRISGYSRDIWGRNIAGISSSPWEGMKMGKCVRCHDRHNRTDGCIDCHK